MTNWGKRVGVQWFGKGMYGPVRNGTTVKTPANGNLAPHIQSKGMRVNTVEEARNRKGPWEIMQNEVQPFTKPPIGFDQKKCTRISRG